MVETPIPNPNCCQMCDLAEETRMHAQMTVSQAPMLQKCRQHGLTYLPTGWTIRTQDHRTSCGAPKDLVHNNTRQFQRARKIWPETSQNSSKIFTSPRCLSRGLTCYTDVEKWSRRLIQKIQTGCQMCDYRQETRMHADDGLSSPHAPKVSLVV
jgi:hypothetical protein